MNLDEELRSEKLLKLVFIIFASDWVFMFPTASVSAWELFIIVYHFCWCIGKDRYRWSGPLVFWCGWKVLAFVFWSGDVNREQISVFLRFTEYERPSRSESHSNRDLGYHDFGSDQKKIINTSNWNQCC